MNRRTPLLVMTASLTTLTLVACGDDDNGVNDTVNRSTEVSVLTNDPSVVNTTVPTASASIPAETLPPTTATP